MIPGQKYDVAPHVGVWIEIIILHLLSSSAIVAPHVGVWIEIISAILKSGFGMSRSPRGSVD